MMRGNCPRLSTMIHTMIHTVSTGELPVFAAPAPLLSDQGALATVASCSGSSLSSSSSSSS
eukprot:8917830-Karenia_brevis.AAC.1